MDFASFDLVRQMAASHYLVRSLHVVAELGVADVVGEAPRPISEVAAQVGADADALRRLLVLLSSRGIFQVSGTAVAHSAASAFLRDGHPASLRSFVRMFGQAIQWDSAGALLEAARTGEAVMPKIFPDGGLWGYFMARPDEGRVFDEAMVAKSQAQIADLLAHHDFSRYRRIVDIGGGQGHMLRAILAAQPGAQGVLFDLPPVIERARNGGKAERLEFMPGDFFSTPLPEGDAIILMEVLHDWDDAAAARILSAVREAARPDARLLVIEIEMTEGPGPDWPKLLDVVMLAAFGARQRTNAEYRALLEANGFVVDRQTSTPAGMTVIEALPAPASQLLRDAPALASAGVR
jgi:SAM-dependent methyltransferase